MTAEEAQVMKRLTDLVAQGEWIREGNRYYPAETSGVGWVEVPYEWIEEPEAA